MENFISLNCPNCGAKLDIIQSKSSFRCPYCGVTHYLRNYAGNPTVNNIVLCPICNRFDRLEKILTVKSKIPYPQAPRKPKGLGFWWILIIWVIMECWVSTPSFLFVFPLSASTTVDDSLTSFLFIGILYLLLFAITCISILFFAKLSRKRKAIDTIRYENEHQIWKFECNKIDKANEIFSRFVYCSYDEKVFDPVTSEIINPDHLNDYNWIIEHLQITE